MVEDLSWLPVPEIEETSAGLQNWGPALGGRCMWQWVIQYLFPGIYVHIPKAQHSVFHIVGTNEINLVEGMSPNPIPLIDKQIDFLLSHFPSRLPFPSFCPVAFYLDVLSVHSMSGFQLRLHPQCLWHTLVFLAYFPTIITSCPGKMFPKNYMVQTCKWFWPKVLLCVAWLPWFYLESCPQPHH